VVASLGGCAFALIVVVVGLPKLMMQHSTINWLGDPYITNYPHVSARKKANGASFVHEVG